MPTGIPTEMSTYLPEYLRDQPGGGPPGNAEGGHRLMAVTPFSIARCAYLRGALAFPSGPASSSSDRKRSSAPE